MKIAYFDCFSGISGDMCLGAIADAGVSIKELENELGKIPHGGFSLSVKRVRRSHFTATKVDVVEETNIGNRKPGLKTWKDIEQIIRNSSLSSDIKQKGLKIFKRIFEAEAKVHGEKFHRVHLHDLGAVDCLADIFGTISGLKLLGIEKIYSSPVNLGSGFVDTENMILPVPAPATSEILKEVPVYSKSVPFELTTPTGAAIIKELSEGFGEMPVMKMEKIGLGAGSRNIKDWPNVLRIFIGKGGQKGIKGGPEDFSDNNVTVIETDIDDMNPQIFEYVLERLFKAGALDVYLTNVIMKKGRPGVKLTALCHEHRRENLINIILKETSTIGLRFYESKRKVLQREIKTTDTEFGKIRVKVSRLEDDLLRISPEYEDCKKIAKKLNIPLIEVMKKIK